MNIKTLTITIISIVLTSCISKKHNIIDIGPSEELRNFIVNEADSIFKLYTISDSIPLKSIPLIMDRWNTDSILTISLKSQNEFRLFHLELKNELSDILILFKNHEIIAIKETDDIHSPNYYVIKYYHKKFRFQATASQCYRFKAEEQFDLIKQGGELRYILM